jgi:hypothetical protein
MGIEEGKDTQAKGIGNIFNKIIADNFLTKKEMPIEVQETSSTPHIHNQNRTSPMLYLK